MTEKTLRNSLQPGYRLFWYEIDKILGKGAFGITYLARDLNLEQLVAIKEFLPIDLAVRDPDGSVHPVSEAHHTQYNRGLERFIKEAQILAHFDHPNIVRVLVVYQYNNTAYMVMRYEHGKSLKDYLKRRKVLEEPQVMTILIPILDGLEKIHRMGFLHRDIKPSNILIREDGSPVLLDFGSAREHLSEDTKTLTSLVSPGYAPFEQYYSKSDQQGPWTDIYGLSATLYRAITGFQPIDAVDRSKAILHNEPDILIPASEIVGGQYSERFLNAVDHALQFKKEDRPQSIAQWKAEFISTDEDYHTVPVEGRGKQSSILKGSRSEVASRWKKGNRGKSRSVLLRRLAVFLLLLPLLGLLIPSSLLSFSAIQQRVVTWLAPTDIAIPATKSTAEGISRQTPDPMNGELTASLDRPDTELFRDQINTLLVNADEDLQNRRYTSPAGNNAFDKYRAVLSMDPGNHTARRGVESISIKLVEKVEKAIHHKKFAEAEQIINKIEFIDPQAEKIKQLRSLLANSEQPEKTNKPHKAASEIIQNYKAGSIFQDVLKNGNKGPYMVVIPNGKFYMGDPEGEKDERPVHQVHFERPFALGRFEITVREFEQFVRSTQHKTGAERLGGCRTYDGKWNTDKQANWSKPGYTNKANYPIVCVDFEDVSAYVKWLSQQTGKAYRLPSEAEWEYATRAQSTTSNFWSDHIASACSYANLPDLTSQARYPSWNVVFECKDNVEQIASVGQFKPNSFGLYDMHGNVWEWIADCWVNNHGKAKPNGVAYLGVACRDHVVRGGSWFPDLIHKEVKWSYRYSFRFHRKADHRDVTQGFRVALDLS